MREVIKNEMFYYLEIWHRLIFNLLFSQIDKAMSVSFSFSNKISCYLNKFCDVFSIGFPSQRIHTFYLPNMHVVMLLASCFASFRPMWVFLSPHNAFYLSTHTAYCWSYRRVRWLVLQQIASCLSTSKNVDATLS